MGFLSTNSTRMLQRKKKASSTKRRASTTCSREAHALTFAFSVSFAVWDSKILLTALVPTTKKACGNEACKLIRMQSTRLHCDLHGEHLLIGPSGSENDLSNNHHVA